MTISVGAAQSFIEGEYGGPTEEQDGEITVDTSATKIVDNDPEALALVIINVGSETAYLMYDDDVSSTRGIILQASGGFVSMNVRNDQTLPTREWWAIVTTGTTDIVYIRTRRYALTQNQPSEAPIATNPAEIKSG